MALSKRDKKLKAMFLEEIDAKKGDVLFNADVFNAMNKQALITLEIHECMEAGKIDFVHEDNSYSQENGGNGPELFNLELEDGSTHAVLCLPHDVDYKEWRAIYDKLIK